jgi:glycosyltransferase involved in cell wall biosynthesis
MSNAPSTAKDAPDRLIRVSIIIPCYNHAHFVADAIDSAVKQSWPHCEVIVVDDGSTDGSGAVARRFHGVRVLRQDNKGLAAARNAGFRASSGDLIIFLDADDRLWPDAARTAVRVATANPGAAMVFGRCRVVNAAGAPDRTHLVTMREHHYEALLRDNCIWTPAMVAFRRNVLEEVGEFDESNSPAADYDLYLRISRAFPVLAHDATVVDYRQHAGNMSSDPVLMLDATLTVLDAQLPYVTNNARRLAAYRDAMANWRALYGERLVERFRTRLRQRRLRAACADALHLLRLYPAGVRYHLVKKLSLMLRGAEDDTGDRTKPGAEAVETRT